MKSTILILFFLTTKSFAAMSENMTVVGEVTDRNSTSLQVKSGNTVLQIPARLASGEVKTGENVYVEIPKEEMKKIIIRKEPAEKLKSDPSSK